MTSSLKKSMDDQAIDRIIDEIAQIIFKCKFCDFITDEKLLLITHYRANHVKTIPPTADQPIDKPSQLDERYVCSLCFTIFLSAESVKEHMIADHGCIPIAEDSQQDANFAQQSVDVEDRNSKKDTDKDLHRPMSLRELQLKLKSSFVLK